MVFCIAARVRRDDKRNYEFGVGRSKFLSRFESQEFQKEGIGMKYKVSILALAISAGFSGQLFASDYNNSNFTVTNTTASPSGLVAVTATGSPVDTTDIDSNGFFKSCLTCKWVDPSTLTQAQRDAIAADPHAGVYDPTTSTLTNVLVDTTAQKDHVVTTTQAGVKTGEAYGANAGGVIQSTAITSGGVASTDSSGNFSTLTSGGVTVVNTSGASASVGAGGATFTDSSGGTTTIAGGNVTNSGDTTTAGATTTGKLAVQGDATVGGSLAVAGPVYGGSLYSGTFSGNSLTGGSAEIGNALNAYGSNLSSLNAWENVAKSQIASLQGDVKKLQGGVALAMASKVPSLDRGEKFGLTANVADFDGTGAIAGGLAIRIDQTWQVNASGGTGFKGGASGGTVGLVGKW